MRHRASRPFIDLWRQLPRATARPLDRLAELSRVRLLAALMVALSLASVAGVVVGSVGGGSPTGDAEAAALSEGDSQIGLGDGEPPESAPDTTLSSAATQEPAPQASDSASEVASRLPSTVDPRTGSTGTGTATPSASPSSQPSVISSTAPEDHTPPNTSVSEEFPDSDSAVFSFTANELTSFTCSLDGSTYTPCDTPTSYSDLDPGWHTFAVRATDAAGNVDPSPATVRWRTGPPHSTDH